MKTLVHPTYFPNIITFATLMQHDIIWEIQDNYQKQTFRNRCYIANDRGRHLLNIPIQHVGNSQGRQKYKNVKLENVYAWQRQHWRTLQTAYRTSPFFEYYEDELAPLYEKKHTYLLEFNLKTIETVYGCLQLTPPIARTTIYLPDVTDLNDARALVNAKTSFDFEQPEYTQVFGDRHGFIANSSILDLLFNEGPNSVEYLKNITLPEIYA
ncbi:MAG: WbqC family protein [Flavobacteriaceae bacterium]